MAGGAFDGAVGGRRRLAAGRQSRATDPLCHARSALHRLFEEMARLSFRAEAVSLDLPVVF
jgi:hypothetical protein